MAQQRFQHTRDEPNLDNGSPPCNYSGDAGHGSQTFASSETWRNALLGTVAAGALLFGYGRRAYATCTTTGLSPNQTVTCTGDITGDLTNGGYTVASPADVSTLNVNSITNPVPIAPTNANGLTFVRTSASITITNDAAIQTTGSGAGILANVMVNAGTISVTNSGDITSEAIAIFAASAGPSASVYNTGSLAAGTFGILVSASAAGTASVARTGDITAASIGVWVSNGSTGTVTIYAGDTVYGGVSGVSLSGVTATGSLANHGTLSGGTYAVLGGAGGDTVNNYGTITGNVDLGSGNNAFNNKPSGIFNSGDTVELDPGNKLKNEGILSPHGSGTVGTTTITHGNLVQTVDGILAIDINGATSDRVTSVELADMAGTVKPNLLSLSATTTFTIVNAPNVNNNGLSVADTAAIDYELAFPLSDDMVNLLIAGVNFAVPGLNRNQTAVARNLNAVFSAGSGGLGSLLAALGNLQSTSELAAALNQLIPEIYSDAQIAALYASLGFSNSLLSCKVNGTDTASIIREGQCLWAGASAQFLDQGTTFSQLGFTETTGLFAAGAQVTVAPDWRLGLGAGYQSSTIDTATNASSDGQTAQGGVALKYNPGAFLLAGVVSGGRAWYDTTRPVAFTGFAGTAQSDSHIDIWNGGVRAAYVFGSPQLYFKPMVDAAATRLDLGGFSEQGGGAANLTIASSKQTVTTIAPSLEIGTEWWMPNGTLIRPFLRGGATWYENGNLALSAAFLGAPAGLTPFTIHTAMDDVMGTVGAGLDVITDTDTVLHLTYDGQIGATTQIHSVGLKASARF